MKSASSFLVTLCTFAFGIGFFEGCSASSSAIQQGDVLEVVTTQGSLQDTGLVSAMASGIVFRGQTNVLITEKHGKHNYFIDGAVGHASDGNVEIFQPKFSGKVHGDTCVFDARWFTLPVATRQPIPTAFITSPESSQKLELLDTAYFLGVDTITIDGQPFSSDKILDRGEALGDSTIISASTLYWYAPTLGYFVREQLSFISPPATMEVTKILRH